MKLKDILDRKRTIGLVVTDWINDWPECAEPGLAEISDQKEDGCVLNFACPGCGRLAGISVGYGTESPWLLQKGDQKDPSTWTLSPSIHCVGCCRWHGYLTEGVFMSGVR